jgi:hypothetical protein
MSLRALLRENERWGRQRLLTRLANPVIQRDRPLHLHLIQRDERGGLFLPSLLCGDATAGRMNQFDQFDQFDQMDQKGSAA